MFRKKKWLVITVLAATLVVFTGIIGGIAYAQSGTPETTTANTTAIDPAETLYARVAAIMGIDQQQMEDAFAQAQQEMRDEELTTRLSNMVEQGTITQDQADQYLQWWQARPDVASELGFTGIPGMSGGPHNGPGCGGDALPPPSETSQTN